MKFKLLRYSNNLNKQAGELEEIKNGFEQNMRKEKRGHVRGTDDCGRAGARG
jgi:hypothetical protein